MKYRLNPSEEKFFRNMDRLSTPLSLVSRLQAPKEDRLLACHHGNRIVISRQKKGRFALFSCTLRGSIQKERGEYYLTARFRRPAVTEAVIFLWSLLLAFTGLQLLFTEPLFALCFLLPAAPLFASLVLFSSKEKKLLTSTLRDWGATPVERN